MQLDTRLQAIQWTVPEGHVSDGNPDGVSTNGVLLKDDRLSCMTLFVNEEGIRFLLTPKLAFGFDYAMAVSDLLRQASLVADAEAKGRG